MQFSAIGAVAPSGISFPNATTMIAYYGDLAADPGQNFILRSTNTGASFTSVAIPSSLASHRLEFDYMFFAPEGCTAG